MVKRSFYFFIEEKVGEEFTRLAREGVGVGVAAEEALREKITEMKGDARDSSKSSQGSSAKLDPSYFELASTLTPAEIENLRRQTRTLSWR